MSYKNKASYRNYPNKRKKLFQMEPGLSGFLCTCNNKLKEKECIWEAYNILNEYADKLFGPEPKESANKEDVDKVPDKSDENEPGQEDDFDDISDALKKEVDSIKTELSKKHELRRFQAIQSGANGMVFIRTTVPDPVKLAHYIVTSLSQVQKSKFLLRLLPVEVTCKAYIEDICKECETLFDKYFSGEEKTFAIVFNHRNNDRLKRDDVIEKVAAIVTAKNDKNKADLKNPQLAILIEVIRSICCISVVPEFYPLKKYNLLELAVAHNTETSSVNEEGDK